MPTSGEVRINGAHVFINDTEMASLKPIAPVVATRKDMNAPAPRPTPAPAGKTGPKRGGKTGVKHRKLGRGSAPVFRGVIRAPVKYLHQDHAMHCGRASLAMLRRNENPNANIYDDPEGGLREMTPHNVSRFLPDYTTVDPQGRAAKEEALREVGASINEGHPAIVKTDLFSKEEHIFVLTGYDPNTGQFTATNTFIGRENGGDPTGMTTMAGLPLDVSHLAAHLKSQGAGSLIFIRTQKKPGTR